MIEITSTHTIDPPLQHITGMTKPSLTAITELESVWAAMFAQTQMKTHIITGSLKASGRPETDYNGFEWSGAIYYGGPSGGINNPVEYAIYEMARGGSHNFFGGLPAYNESLKRAVKSVFKR
jgi:hypothetical protein